MNPGKNFADMIRDEFTAEEEAQLADIERTIAQRFSALRDTVADIANLKGGLPFPNIPQLPAPGIEFVRNKVIKLSDAIWILHLYNAYVVNRVLANQMILKINTLKELYEEILFKWARKKLIKTAKEKLAFAFEVIVKFTVWIERLIRIADAVNIQKAIARRIRFFGRAARQDLAESYLAFGQKNDGHPRITRKVSSRHGRKDS